MGTNLSKSTNQREHSEENMEESKAGEQGAPNESPSSRSGDAKQTGLEQINDNVLKEIGTYLPIKDMQRAESQLQHPSRGKNKFFQETLDEAKMAKPLLKAVVTGNPDALIVAIKKNPQAFFMQGDIKTPSSQVFYTVTAAQMIIFLCDDDMKMLVERAIAEAFPAEDAQAFIQQWQAQVQALGRGGADLVKLDCDPLLDQNFSFEDLLQFKKTYTMFDHTTQEVRHSLLENPDGIAYYKDNQNQVHWYYVSLDTPTITPVDFTPVTIPDDLPENEKEKLIAQQQTYDDLIATMDAMEPKSAKRSSTAEHRIIANMMKAENKPVELVRQGIQYERNGECYGDSRHDFNRQYNGYRECIRLYEQGQWDEGDQVFREKLHQGEVMWLLERFCEEGRPFYPLPDFKSSPFRRGLNIYNFFRGGQPEAVYDVNSGYFANGFGSNFAIYKVADSAQCIVAPADRGGRLRCRQERDAAWRCNFVAVSWLAEEAKANVSEFKFDQDLTHQGARPAC